MLGTQQGVYEIKNKHVKICNYRQFLLIIQIMIIFYMKSCAMIILSMKYRYTMMKFKNDEKCHD